VPGCDLPLSFFPLLFHFFAASLRSRAILRSMSWMNPDLHGLSVHSLIAFTHIHSQCCQIPPFNHPLP
jgi:hypothetical protein